MAIEHRPYSTGNQWVPIALGACLVMIPAIVLGEDAREVLNQAKVGWAELKLFVAHVEGSGSLTEAFISTKDSGSDFVTRREFKFKVNGDSELITRFPREIVSGKRLASTADDGITVMCAGPRNTFLISRKSDRDDWFVMYAGASRDEKVMSNLRAGWSEYLSAPWSTGGVSFNELFDHSGMAVTGMERLTRAGNALVTINFTFTPSKAEMEARSLAKPLWALRSGSLTFWPAEHWCLTKSSLNVAPAPGATVTEVTTVDYDKQIEGFVLPVKIARETAFTSYRTEDVVVFDDLAPGVVPTDDFSLTAYGLPELGTVPPASHSRQWFVVANVLIVVGIIALYAYRRQRRRRVPAQPG